MTALRRLRLVLWFVLTASAVPGASRAGDVDIHVNIGAPPPPRILFDREPDFVVVPRTDVYYLPGITDYDFYRYGGYWYVNRDGWWYRAKSYRGPFSPIEVVRVPKVIVGLPAQYRRHPAHPHGGPPGQTKKQGGGGHGPPGHSKKGGKGK